MAVMTGQAGEPMRTIHNRAPWQDGACRDLLVMLPGAMDVPEDFLRHGFVQALRERRLPVDAILVDAHIDHYFGSSIASRLTQDVILPACACQYRQIWLMGISLGGMGALICARDHPSIIDGVILLAPFLGNRRRIAEIVRCGGLKAWQPGEVNPQDDEQSLWAWLKAYRPNDPALLPIYLGYGMADRFAPTGEMLAQHLPAERVAAMQGGHDWATWTHLWKHLLDQGLFSGNATLDRPREQRAAIK